jgi:hypothetical protein
MVGLDPVVGVLGGVVECGRQELRDSSDQDMGPVSGDLGRITVGPDRGVEEPCSRLDTPLGEDFLQPGMTIRTASTNAQRSK